MLFLIDLDSPLTDFEGAFLRLWREKYPEEKWIPLEERRTFALRDEYSPELLPKLESIYLAPGFFLNLPLVEGAKEAVDILVGLGHEVCFCSSPLGKYENCVLEKYRWIEKNFGHDLTRKIILTKDKTLVRGDFLIDDRPPRGILKPQWEHIIYDMPYNQHLQGRRITWKNWREVLKI